MIVIYNYLRNQCLTPLKLWVRTCSGRGVLDTTLCDEVCQWLATGRWFTPVFSTNKTDRHDISEILLKVALNTINPTTFFILSRFILKALLHGKASIAILVSCNFLYHDPCRSTFHAEFVYKLFPPKWRILIMKTLSNKKFVPLTK